MFKDYRSWKKVARNVSNVTGRSYLYHFLDGTYCRYRYGCSPLHYGQGGFYKLRPFDRRRTYTIGRGMRLSRQLNGKAYSHLLINKEEFNRFYSPLISRSWLYAADADATEILSFVKRLDTVFVKPTDKERGLGMRLLHASEMTEEKASEIAGQKLLLEQYLVQHPNMEFGGGSVNTIRITTMIDREGIVHLLKAMVRCGIGDSIVDNFCSGGVAYPVDLELGVIEGTGVLHGRRTYEPIYVHPGTDTLMLGRIIPFWAETVALVEKAAVMEPRLRFVGWDVAILPDGPELIEGNTFPGAVLVDMTGSKRNIYEEIKRWM